MERIKKLFKCTNVRMATKSEVKELTGFYVGTIPLFGLSLPYINDRIILKAKCDSLNNGLIRGFLMKG